MYNFIPVNLFPKNVTNIIFEQKTLCFYILFWLKHITILFLMYDTTKYNTGLFEKKKFRYKK